MKHLFFFTALLACVLLAAPCAPPANAQSLQVSLLNLTGQAVGPVFLLSHPALQDPLLDPSEPPSEALKAFAAGQPAMLAGEIAAHAGGSRHAWSGTIQSLPPGERVGVEIRTQSYHRNLSLAAALPGGGIAGIGQAFVGQYPVRVDALAWEAGETLIVHRTQNSPALRVSIRYVRPQREDRRPPPSWVQSLDAGQREQRAACLASSPTCAWRLEGGRGLCFDCVPPLRPDADRARCVG